MPVPVPTQPESTTNGGQDNPPALPFLPEISDDLRQRVFRHSGLMDNNQRLSLLGSSILPLIVTEWLLDTLPNATPGDITIERSKLVDKNVVSNWCAAYKLQEQLQCAANELTVRGSIPGRCQLFYAYIGAIRQTADPDEAEKEYGWTQVNTFVRQLLDATDRNSL